MKTKFLKNAAKIRRKWDFLVKSLFKKIYRSLINLILFYFITEKMFQNLKQK